MEIKNNSVLPICAVRYALGRRDYMPYLVAEEIESLLTKMDGDDLCLLDLVLGEHLLSLKEIDKWDATWGGLWEAVLKELRKRE